MQDGYLSLQLYLYHPHCCRRYRCFNHLTGCHVNLDVDGLGKEDEAKKSAPHSHSCSFSGSKSTDQLGSFILALFIQPFALPLSSFSPFILIFITTFEFLLC